MGNLRIFRGVLVSLSVTFPVWASVQISQVRMLETAHAELTIATTPGDHYRLQCSSNLAEEGWINYGESFEATDLTTVQIVDVAAACGFFRVVRTPQSIPSITAGPPGPPPAPPVDPADSTDPVLPTEPPSPPSPPPAP